MRWDEFAAGCPDLAHVAEERFTREQIVLLGTVRANGAPRISGVECDFVAGDLMTGMIWRSTKALDLLRDPRVTIHSLVPDKQHEAQNQGDLKLHGMAVEVTDRGQRARYQAAIFARIGWQPSEPYHCFAFDIEHAGMVRFVDGQREVWSWRSGGNLVRRTIPEAGPE